MIRLKEKKRRKLKLTSQDIMITNEYYELKLEIEQLKHVISVEQSTHYKELIDIFLIHYLYNELQFGFILISDILELDEGKIRKICSRYKWQNGDLFSIIAKFFFKPNLSNEFITKYENFTAKFVKKCNKKVFKL